MGGCGERRPVAYCADLLTHNLKVMGSNLTSATKKAAKLMTWRLSFSRRSDVLTLCQQKPWRPVAARSGSAGRP